MSDLFLPHARFIEKFTYKYYLSQKLVALYARIFKLENEGQRFITGYHKHATAAEIISKMGLDAFQSYYSFCFVRNPYDHMVSLYHYIRESRGHYLHKTSHELSFDDFIMHYISTKPQTQSDFVYVGGEKRVTFVGKFERLEEDLTAVCAELNIPFSGVSHANSSKRGRNYMSYFKSEEALEAFNSFFVADFTHFNYTLVPPNSVSHGA